MVRAQLISTWCAACEWRMTAFACARLGEVGRTEIMQEIV